MGAERILREVFGYAAFRPGQEEIVGHLLAGEHVLAVMPTGAGKSLCYQIPALLNAAPTVVVSPLVALMDDQVAGLRGNGVAAGAIHSGLPRDCQVDTWRAFRSGSVRLLYLSPERLMTDRMLAALQNGRPPGMFVIDEAHCISRWGASFRPEYEDLARLRDLFPDSVIAAFTATADRATRADITARLFGGRGRNIVQGFDRPNLGLAVAVKTDWRRQLMAFIGKHRGCSGIVYCLSRKFTEEVAAFLNDQGQPALPYHAGQPSGQRRAAHDRFMSEEGLVMVATIAFGMGIDKPDIRFVCHLNLPGSMEAFYQEIGRAGRDGAPADTLLLYGLEDIRLRQQFILTDCGEDDERKTREYKRLDALLAYCETAQCRRRALLAWFDETVTRCGNCDNCLAPPALVDQGDRARLLFDTIDATGQMFGGGHIIDILRGTKTAKVEQRGHDRLRTWGQGAEQGKKLWNDTLRQAVAGGYLRIDIERYGRLVLTDRGQRVRRGEEGFPMRQTAATSAAAPAAASRRARSPVAVPGEADGELLTALKRLRLDLARQRQVPAYVIFSDATLIEMARRRPRNLDQLADINGVGPRKLSSFGPAFLELTAAAPAD